MIFTLQDCLMKNPLLKLCTFADLKEKNHQVEMMSHIYGNASKVCVWLGEANETSCTALKFTKDEVLLLRDFDELCERPDASKKWNTLLELM